MLGDEDVVFTHLLKVEEEGKSSLTLDVPSIHQFGHAHQPYKVAISL